MTVQPLAPMVSRVRSHVGLTWVAAVGVAELLLVFVDAPSILRLPITLLFVMSVPGFLLLDLREPADPVAKVVLGVGASLATHLVAASLYLAPDPLWISAAAVAAYVGARHFFDLGMLGGRRASDRSGAPADRPASEWVPLHPESGPATTEPTGDPSTDAESPLTEDPSPDGSTEADVHSREEPVEVAPPMPAGSLPSIESLAPPVRPHGTRGVAQEEVGRPDVQSPAVPAVVESSAAQTQEPTVSEPAASVTHGESNPDDPFFAAAPPLDLNGASMDDLVGVSGVGEKLAARILDHRTEIGRFEGIEDLLEVSGIGPARLASLRAHLAVLVPPDRPEGSADR